MFSMAVMISVPWGYRALGFTSLFVPFCSTCGALWLYMEKMIVSNIGGFDWYNLYCWNLNWAVYISLQHRCGHLALWYWGTWQRERERERERGRERDICVYKRRISYLPWHPRISTLIEGCLFQCTVWNLMKRAMMGSSRYECFTA